MTTPPNFDKGTGEPAPQPYGQPYGQPAGYAQPGGFGEPGAYGTPYGSPAPYGTAGGVVGPGGEWLGPPLAGWGSRLGATLLDGLIILGLAIVVGLLLAVASSASEGLAVLVTVLGYAGIIAFAVWQAVVQGRTGQTIGKRATRIKLVRLDDGQPIGAGLSILRYFVHVVDQIPLYLGYLWPLWDNKKQTFTDKILKTVVIKA